MNRAEADDAEVLIKRFISEGFHADCVVFVQPCGYVHVWMKTPEMVAVAKAWAARAGGTAQGDRAEAA